MNRIDKVVVFHPLRRDQLEQVLDIELDMVQQRVLETARSQFVFHIETDAREFLLGEGTDIKYGARHLKRAIEKFLVYPLANLLATGQIQFGDVLTVNNDPGNQRLRFFRESGGALVPAGGPALGAFAQVAQAPGGRAVNATATPNTADVKSRPAEQRPVAMPAPAAVPRGSDQRTRRGSL